MSDQPPWNTPGGTDKPGGGDRPWNDPDQGQPGGGGQSSWNTPGGSGQQGAGGLSPWNVPGDAGQAGGGGSPAGQPGQPAQPGGYGQPGQPAQPGGYGQPGQPGQPGGYGQPGQPAQPGGYGQPGQPGQPGGYGQPGQPAQPGGYGQPGQPGGFGQPGQPGGFGQQGAFGPPPGFPGQPAKKRRGPLIAVIVLLLVAVVGVGGILAWQFVRGGGDSLAAHVPADSILYSHVNLNPSASNKLGIVSLIDRVNEAAGEDLIAIDDLLGDLETDAEINFAEDVDPWLGQEIAAFFTDIPAPDPETFETSAPVAGVLIALDDAEAAATFIEDNDPLDDWDAGEGRQGWLVEGDLDEDDAFVLAIDGAILYGGTPDAVRDALEVEGEDALGSAASYTAAVDTLPDRVLTFWIDTPAVVEAVAAQSLQMLPEGQAIPGAAAVGVGFGSGSLDITAVTTPAEGEVPEITEDIAPVALDSLPAGGLLYGRAPDIGALLPQLLEAADMSAQTFAEEFGAEPVPDEELPGAMFDAGLEEQFGTSVEEISGWLGDIALMLAYDPTESADNAALLIRAGVADEDAATDLLDTAVEAAQLAEADGIEVESGSVSAGDASIAVADGSLSVTLGTPADTTLADDETYHAAIEGLEGEAVLYVDVRGIVDAVVAFAQPSDDAGRQVADVAGAFDSLVATYVAGADGAARSSVRLAFGSELEPIDYDAGANPPDVDLGPLGTLDGLLEQGEDAVGGMIPGGDPLNGPDPTPTPSAAPTPGGEDLTLEDELAEMDIDLRDAAATMETEFFVDGAYVQPDIEFPVFLEGSTIIPLVQPEAYCLVGVTPSGGELIYDSFGQTTFEPVEAGEVECQNVLASGGTSPDEPVPDATDGPFAFGDDPTLDGLYTACEGGDFAACDQLFLDSPIGSDYENFALTCGDRNEPSSEECAVLYPQ